MQTVVRISCPPCSPREWRRWRLGNPSRGWSQPQSCAARHARRFVEPEYFLCKRAAPHNLQGLLRRTTLSQPCVHNCDKEFDGRRRGCARGRGLEQGKEPAENTLQEEKRDAQRPTSLLGPHTSLAPKKCCFTTINVSPGSLSSLFDRSKNSQILCKPEHQLLHSKESSTTVFFIQKATRNSFLTYTLGH